MKTPKKKTLGQSLAKKKKKIGRFFNRIRLGSKHAQLSYAQSGEDLIVNFLLMHVLKIDKPSYLDVGAHAPDYLSNTYFFYKQGSRGVCVEPDPSLIPPFKKLRPKDVTLNVGVGFDSSTSADFYVMDCKTLNTFSKEEAERCAKFGTFKIDKVVPIPLMPINQIMAEHFPEGPHFLSLDVEGIDYEILQSIDLIKYRPVVICIETARYSEDGNNERDGRILNFMKDAGYTIYADTYINTIFVDRAKWDCITH